MTGCWVRLGKELGRLEQKTETDIHFCDTVLPIVQEIEKQARLEGRREGWLECFEEIKILDKETGYGTGVYISVRRTDFEALKAKAEARK